MIDLNASAPLLLLPPLDVTPEPHWLVQLTTIDSEVQTPQAATLDRTIDKVQLTSDMLYSEIFQAEGEPEMMMFAKGSPVQRAFS